LSPQARSKNELSPAETNNISAAYFIVSDALSLCRERLLSQETNADDPSSQNTFQAARSSIEANLELMQNLRLRFNNGRSKVSPPDSELIRSIAMSSAKVAGIVGDPARLPDVIQAAAEIVERIQALQEL
jgi:hypothetical protein